MTPRERILATLRHETPDRIPTDAWFHPEVMQTLKQHFKTDDKSVVLNALGIEGWGGLSAWIEFPEFEQRCRPRPGHPESHRAIWLDDRTYEDAWGIRWRWGDADRYQQWLSGPLQDAENAKAALQYRFPTIENIREPDGYAERVAALKRSQLFVSGGIENPFKRLWHLRGYENALMDYLANRDLVDAIYDRLFDCCTEACVRMARAGVDMIQVVGDIAMQDRIIMGPELWREVDKPRWAKLIAACRRVNQEAAFFFHSDGKLTDLIGDLIEVGFTVINPIQPECVDPVEVKKQWGDRITLHGCISLQRTLPFGSVADVRHEVEGLIRHCGYNGGLVLMPSNVIQPDTPAENIIACFQTARDFAPRPRNFSGASFSGSHSRKSRNPAHAQNRIGRTG
ncbi:MAG: hypothetical protein HY360_01990 [Verrucomicrobia bacterium]|nr:hypothetical protein [Verrucomicrobiota bacterium]